MLIGVLALLASLAIIIFLIVPRVSEMRDLSNNIAAKEAELEIGKKKVSSLRSAVQLIKTARRDMEILGVAVPADKDIAEALVQVNANASNSGVVIDAISTSGGEAGNVSINASVKGSYEQIMGFLSNSEKNLRPIKIVDYNLVSTEGTISATFNMLFPYLATKTEVAQEGEAAAEGEGTEETQVGEEVQGVESGQ